MAIFACILFCQADCADIRQAEYRRRDIGVIHRAVLLGLEQPPRHGHAFSQGHRRQLHTTNHIANRQDRRLGGLVEIIHRDETALVQFDPGIFQAQVIQHWTAASGVEHAIGFQHAAILQSGLEAAVGLFVDALDVCIELQVQAALGQLFLQVFAHRTVKTAQEQVTAIQQ